MEKKGCGSSGSSGSGSDAHVHDSSCIDTDHRSSSSSADSPRIPTPAPIDISSSTLYQRLQVCPLHCIPLSRDMSKTLKSQSYTENENHAASNDLYKPPTPVVIGSPNSKARSIISTALLIKSLPIIETNFLPCQGLSCPVLSCPVLSCLLLFRTILTYFIQRA